MASDCVTLPAAAYRKLLTYGAPVAAVIALVMPFVHIGALAVVPLLVGVHLVTVRVVLVRDAQRMLRPMRRLLNRWLARFFARGRRQHHDVDVSAETGRTAE